MSSPSSSPSSSASSSHGRSNVVTDQPGGKHEGQDPRGTGNRLDRRVLRGGSTGERAPEAVPDPRVLDPGIAAALDVVHSARLYHASEWEMRPPSGDTGLNR